MARLKKKIQRFRRKKNAVKAEVVGVLEEPLNYLFLNAEVVGLKKEKSKTIYRKKIFKKCFKRWGGPKQFKTIQNKQTNEEKRWGGQAFKTKQKML